MTITTTELLLFAWAILATAYGASVKDTLKASIRFISHLLENPDVYALVRERHMQNQTRLAKKAES